MTENQASDVRKSKNLLPDLAQSMVDVANILSKGNFTGAPENDWITKVSNMFDVIVNKVPDKNQLKKLQDFIEVLKDFSKAADKIKDSGIEKLNKLTASVTIMSVIDDQRLQSVIKVLDTNKENLSNIIEGKGNSQVETRRQVTTEIERTTTGGPVASVDKQDKMVEQLVIVNKKFDDLLEYVVQSQGPDNTGKEDTTKKG